jgi:uncharacterized protein (TIGR03118 family)
MQQNRNQVVPVRLSCSWTIDCFDDLMMIHEPEKEAQRVARFGVTCSRKSAMSVGVCMVVVLGIVAPARAGSTFSVTNLITNDQTVNKAQITDPNLVNPWGVSFGPATPLWVSNEGTGVASLYTIAAGDQVSIVNDPSLFPVVIRGGEVTGQFFNPSSTAFNGDPFVFVTLGGAVEGWRPALGNTAEVLSLANSANSYDGSTLVTVNGNEYLLAANTKTGNIDVLNGTAGQPGLPGNFKDPNLPTGFVPYNVQVLNGVVYVTYEQPGKTGGIVDAFSTSGNFLARVGTGGSLDQPWGLAIAPTSFGSLAGDLLVGNKGSGEISVFNLTNDTALGTLNGTNGSPIVIQDLWSLTIGNGGNAGSEQEIYFTAGVGGYKDGLLGAIQLQSVPEPSSAVLGLISVGLLAARGYWQKRRHRATA